MSLVLDFIGWACLTLGAAFAVIGGIGLVRFPDFYTRMHGAGVTDTMGAGLVLIGLLVLAPSWLVAIKLVTILVFVLIASPTSGHALARAALATGLEPWTAPRGTASKEGPPSTR